MEYNLSVYQIHSQEGKKVTDTMWQATLVRILAAIAIGTIIGVEREYKNRPAGMRTHVLVCLGACTVALLESSFIADLSSDAIAGGAIGYSFGRLSAQVISGIGFLGAGTIFTAQRKIVGLTTAASLWCVGCLGLAVGYGYYFIAGVGCVCVIAVLMAMQRIVHVNTVKKVEITFIHRVESMQFVNDYFREKGIKTIDLDFHVESRDGTNIYTNIYTLQMPNNVSYTEVINQLSEYPNMMSVRTTTT